MVINALWVNARSMATDLFSQAYLNEHWLVIPLQLSMHLLKGFIKSS